MSNSTANQIIQPKSRTLILYGANDECPETGVHHVSVQFMEVLGFLVRPDNWGNENGNDVIDYLVVGIDEWISETTQPFWLTKSLGYDDSEYWEFIWNAWPQEEDMDMIDGAFVAFRGRAAAAMKIQPWSPGQKAAREAKGVPV